MMTQRDPYVNMLRVDDRDLRRRSRRRQCGDGAAVHARARLAGRFRAARRAQHAAYPAGGIQSREGRRSGRRLRRHRGADRRACAARRGRCSRRSRRPAARRPRSSGLIQNKVAETRAEREKAVATRKDPLTGTSEFPHLSEARGEGAVARRRTPRRPPLARNAEQAHLARGAALPSVSPSRSKRLRDASDAILKATGARPKVFLATLGKPADYIARATFAKNFFEAGGIEAVEVCRRRSRRGLQGIRRHARLPVLVGRGLCARGGRGRSGTGGGRCDAHLSRRPARRSCRRAEAGRREDLHLRRMRRACDAAGGLRHTGLKPAS